MLSEADTEAASSTFASKWTERSRDSRFSGYCVIALSDALSVLALGNLQGYIKLLQLNEEGMAVTLCMRLFATFPLHLSGDRILFMLIISHGCFTLPQAMYYRKCCGKHIMAKYSL